VPDILEDLKSRLIDIGFNDPKIDKVIMAIRTDWRGERPYISIKDDAETKIKERNRSIIREYKNGESVALLARRHGISRTRIYAIING
jgi:Mor family transcriptional regulator